MDGWMDIKGIFETTRTRGGTPFVCIYEHFKQVKHASLNKITRFTFVNIDNGKFKHAHLDIVKALSC